MSLSVSSGSSPSVSLIDVLYFSSSLAGFAADGVLKYLQSQPMTPDEINLYVSAALAKRCSHLVADGCASLQAAKAIGIDKKRLGSSTSFLLGSTLGVLTPMIPYLVPVELAVNTLSAYSISSRSLEELKKCKEHLLFSEKKQFLWTTFSAFIHTANSAFCLKKTLDTALFCQEYFFPEALRAFPSSFSSPTQSQGALGSHLSKEQKMDQILALSETKSKQDLLCEVCPPACSSSFSLKEREIAKKTCKNALALDLHPDKNPSLVEKATQATQVLTSIFSLGKKEAKETADEEIRHIFSRVEGYIDLRPSEGEDKDAFLQKMVFKISKADPCAFLQEVCSDIQAKSVERTFKYFYQKKELMNDHYSRLSKGFSKTIEEWQRLNYDFFWELRCPSVLEQSQKCVMDQECEEPEEFQVEECERIKTSLQAPEYLAAAINQLVLDTLFRSLQIYHVLSELVLAH